MSITGKQIAMARILLDLSQKDLADKLDIARKTIMRIENNQSPGSSKTIAKIQSYFENHAIEFIKQEGLRQNKNTLRILHGHQGFSDFLDDVYNTAIEQSSAQSPTEVFLSNVDHDNWVKWMGPIKWKKHVGRMTKDQSLMDVKILIKDGDLNRPASAYSEYKWIPEEFFNDNSFYSYGDKLAFLDFEDDDVIITIMQHAKFAQGYRALFKIAWDHFAKPLPNEADERQ